MPLALVAAALVCIASSSAARAAGATRDQPLATPWFEGFEGGLAGWTPQTTSGVATWHARAHPEALSVSPALNPFAVALPDDGRHLAAAAGDAVAWFGDDSTGAYLGRDYPVQGARLGGTSREPQAGTLTSPFVALPAVGGSILEFDSWWEIEGTAGPDYDVMQIGVDTAQGVFPLGELNPSFVVAQPRYSGASSGGPSARPVWRHYRFDLSAWAGATIAVRLSFATGDAECNGFRGWTIDNLAIESIPGSLPAPRLTALGAGAGGVVTVSGAGFVQGARLVLGGQPLPAGSVTQLGVSDLLFQAPALAAGSYDVQLINPDGQSATLPGGYVVTSAAPPALSALSPAAAQMGRAQAISLSGSGFTQGVSVLIGGLAAADVVVVSDSQLTATAPALGAGFYNVTVSGSAGNASTLFASYQVDDAAVIAVSAPAGGEVWSPGETHTLSWDGTGFSSVDLQLYAGGAFAAGIASGVSGRSFAWTVPAALAGMGYSVRVANSGGTRDARSAGTFTIAAPTRIALTASQVQASLGDAITLSAAAGAAGVGPAQGSVTFFDGASALGQAALSADGVALLATSALALGGHAITARYPGAGLFAPAVSSALGIDVGRIQGALSLSATAPELHVNRPVSLRAQLSATGPLRPTGSVIFSDGAVALGGAPLDGAGTATLAVRSLGLGAHPISASYGGSESFAPLTAAVSVTIGKSTPVAGSGSALVLDGQGQHASLDDAAGALDGARTVELWFARAATDGPGDAACMLQHGEGAGLRFGLCLTAARDGLEVRHGASVDTVPLPALDGWHHLALVDEGAHSSLHLDGARIAMLDGGFGAGAAQPLFFGAAPAGAPSVAAPFTGSLDEVRFWSRALGEAELIASRQRPVASDAAGLLALFRMDEGAGSALFDSGPRHLAAALSGGPRFAPSTAWQRRTAAEAQQPFPAGYDPDGAPLTVTLVAQAGGGTAQVDGTLLDYAPGAGFTGTDAFTYSVESGGSSSEFTVQIEGAAASAQAGSSGCATSPRDSGWGTLVPLFLFALLLRRRGPA